MNPTNNIRQVCAFIGLLNYYRDMWDIRSHLLQPLTEQTSTKVTFKWADVEQNAFNKIKQIVTHNTLLIYLYFNKCFDIHTYDSNFQLGAVISQNGKPIAFNGRKLTPAQ